MEDCVSNSLWIVRVSGHALRPYKFPCTLPTFMNELFKDILDLCVVVYLGDILIYSDNPGEHLKHVREVLRRLRASTLHTKVEKCAFSVDTTTPSVSLLALTTFEWTRRDPRLADTTKGKDVQSFLGFANFYRRFIASYSDISPTDSAHAQGRPVGLVSAM